MHRLLRLPDVDDDGFELIVRQARREFLGSGQRRQPESPFYHYAPEGGLVGVLEAECLWATDYRFLNDREEVERGEHAVQAELESVSRNIQRTPRVAFWLVTSRNAVTATGSSIWPPST